MKVPCFLPALFVALSFPVLGAEPNKAEPAPNAKDPAKDAEYGKAREQARSESETERSRRPVRPLLSETAPEEVGLDKSTLAGIRPTMEKMSAEKLGAGAVMLIVRQGRIGYFETAGLANVEAKQPMKKDSIFWIASMTKPITSTAVMILVEEGKLSLDEPASKWVPELAKVTMASGQPLTRPITLRDLLSHTSGLADPPRNPSDGNVTLEQYTKDLLSRPFNFQPGEKYAYSFGLTVAGRCVEVASGQPFETFLDERILKPLHMKDTTFFPTAEQRTRIVRSYKVRDGQYIPAHNYFLTPDPDIRREPEPSGGLFSTAQDMAAFFEMIRLGGVLKETRILSEKSVREMTRPHLVGGQPTEYGLGFFNAVTDKTQSPQFGKNAFGHPGAFSVLGWIDPEAQMTVIFMISNMLVPKGEDMRAKFCEMAKSAVK